MPETNVTGNQNQGSSSDLISDADLEKKVKLTIYGKEEVLPLKDALTKLQKSEAADKKFSEAKEVERLAEKALDVMRDLQDGYSKRDPASLRRAFINAGWSQRDVDSLFAAPAKEEPEGEEEETVEGDNPVLQRKLQELESQLGVLTGAYNKAQEQAKDRTWRGEVNGALDSDPELSKILKSYDPETQEWVRSQAQEEVRKANQTIPWGPKAIHTGLETLKKRLTKLGHQPESDESTPDAEGSDTYPGLGPAGNSVSSFHRKASNEKVPSLYDPGYAANFKTRLRNLVRGR
jgi:hypothetical protein